MVGIITFPFIILAIVFNGKRDNKIRAKMIESERIYRDRIKSKANQFKPLPINRSPYLGPKK